MRVTLRRVIWIAVVAGAAVFAVQGGEYGTDDLLSQARRKKHLAATIDSLTKDVDSLSRLKRRVLTDPALQERIAREEFGMVRGDKELLFRFSGPPDSARATLRP